MMRRETEHREDEVLTTPPGRRLRREVQRPGRTPVLAAPRQGLRASPAPGRRRLPLGGLAHRLSTSPSFHSLPSAQTAPSFTASSFPCSLFSFFMHPTPHSTPQTEEVVQSKMECISQISVFSDMESSLDPKTSPGHHEELAGC